jgi:HD superfamily phosphohydrolase
MGNIVSGPIDADKLDYLSRDSSFAGLPLKYDLERFLYTIGLATGSVGDEDQKLSRLYQKAGFDIKPRLTDQYKYPVFDSLELRPPRQLISTIEQITICKFMLFSYIYHHKKVRAAEGMLIKLLQRIVSNWQDTEAKKDEEILLRFMEWKDDALMSPEFLENGDATVREYAHRIVNRLLTRLVFGFVTNNKSAAQTKLKIFAAKLAEPKIGEIDPKRQAIDAFEGSMRKELERQLPQFNGEDILLRTGVWLDAPKAPSFETTESLKIGNEGLPLRDVFPIKAWVDGYQANRYSIRIFAFSEYMTQARKAVKIALEEVVNLTVQELDEIGTAEFFPT